MPNAFKQVLRRSFHRPRRRHRHVELRHVDQLETRILPTANVTFTGAALTIQGDTGGNFITVERVGAQLHVDANGGSITVLGSSVPEFFFNLNGAFNLTATFGDAGDHLKIDGGIQLKSVKVDTGDGGDWVEIDNATLSGKLTLTGGDGGNLFHIGTTSVTGNTLITTGDDGDLIEAIDSRFFGSTTINTNGGGDLVSLKGVASRTKFVGKLTITSGVDGDLIELITVESKAVSIDSGDDGDLIDFEDVLVNGGISVKSGEAGDLIEFTSVFQSGSGPVLIDSGSEGDLVELEVATFAGPTTVNLGNDADANLLEVDDVTFSNTFTLNSKAAGDLVEIEQENTLVGQTTFAKTAKFNLGSTALVEISSTFPETKTSFLSNVSFSSGLPGSTLTFDLVNTSFAKPPKLKNVTIV